MTPDKTTDSRHEDNWVDFAWQGISFVVPAEWQLDVTEGNRKAGYVRLVDETSVRLEIRWDVDKGKGTIGEIVSGYLKGMRKRSTRKKKEFKVLRDINLISFPEAERDFECYSWEADLRAVCLFSRSKTAKRTVHIQVLGSRGEKLRSRARRIFGSFRDFPEGEMEPWSFYDFKCSIPRGFALKAPDLKTGCIKMSFARSSEVLDLARISLARVVLEKQSLAEWVHEFAKRTLRGFSVQAERGRIKGHDALGISGRQWRLRDIWGLVAGRRLVRLTAWHCEESDKIYYVSWISRKGTDEDFARIVAGFKCHDE